MRLTKGIVFFCDILGYKSLIENNSTTESAKIIVNHIAGINDKIIKEICAIYQFDETTRNIGYCYLKNKMECVIVSDTIIIFFDLDEYTDKDREFHSVSCLMIITYILSFIRTMFEKGLPLRGCVGFGEYFVFENMFAGKVISECYKESEKLDFTGVMITKECYKNIIKNSRNKEFIKLFKSFVELIRVPLKNKVKKDRYIFNWIDDLTWKKNRRQKLISNTKIYIMEKMTAHNKTLNNKSMSKYNNSVYVIDRLCDFAEKR